MIRGRYTTVKGFLWPAEDAECRRAVFRTLPDLDAAVGLTQRRHTAVQAGGNAGVWPLHLSKTFKRVVTFEPDPNVFHCLTVNTRDAENIERHRAALGGHNGRAGLILRDRNTGAQQVDPDETDGPIRVMTLDSLKLKDVDLIALDVEGFELFAILGAQKTIAKSRPVIMVECNRQAERYEVDQRACVQFLVRSMDYEVKRCIRRDVILAPR